jgi:hypothetical protein
VRTAEEVNKSDGGMMFMKGEAALWNMRWWVVFPPSPVSCLSLVRTAAAVRTSTSGWRPCLLET